MNRRSVLFWGGLVALLVFVGLVSGGRTQSGEPLDPDSTDPLGTRALMLFLEEFDADVVRGLPDDSVSTALLLDDRLTEEQRVELEAWVEGGGTLVVTDPSSEFSPQGFQVIDESGTLASGTCAIESLRQLTLEADAFILYPDQDEQGLAAADLGGCFGGDGESYLQASQLGQGRLVALGGALALTNENLDEADNAVLAARLLLDDSGSSGGNRVAVAVIYDNVLASGSRTLGDLIPSAAKWASAQLLVAFGLYVLWRAPRFGRPVAEPQPVELPGSLLVRATGELHRRSRGHAEASQALRNHVGRRVRKQLRASPELPMPDLVQVAAAGHDIDGAVIQRALAGGSASNGQELADLLVDIDQVNDIILSETTNHPPPVGEPT